MKQKNRAKVRKAQAPLPHPNLGFPGSSIDKESGCDVRQHNGMMVGTKSRRSRVGDITHLAWHHIPTPASPSPSSPPAHRRRRNARMSEVMLSPDSAKVITPYPELSP